VKAGSANARGSGGQTPLRPGHDKALVRLVGWVEFGVQRSWTEGEKDGAVITCYRYRCAVRGKDVAPVANRRCESRPVRLRQVALGEMNRERGGILRARNALESTADMCRQRTYTPYRYSNGRLFGPVLCLPLTKISSSQALDRCS
jgi:hypothetical protein